MIAVRVINGGYPVIQVTISGVTFNISTYGSGNGYQGAGTVIVPTGATYKVSPTNVGALSLVQWVELR